jgi:hypothetical protein
MLAQAFFVVITLLVGVSCQLIFFKSDDNSFLEALRAWPWLWLLYFAVGHVTAERLGKILGHSDTQHGSPDERKGRYSRRGKKRR